jgi:hypothetical protein
MKKFNNYWASLIVMIAFSNITLAQTSLGSSQNFLDHLKKDLTLSAAKGAVSGVSLKVNNSKSFEAKVNYKKSDATSEFLIGEIKNNPASSFYIRIIDKTVEGHILFMNKKEAYKYYSDVSGNVYVSKVDINSIICTDYRKTTQKQVPISNDQMKIAPAMLNLQSLPGAAGCVMLDFDGYYMAAGNLWNNGNPINAAPSGVSDAGILEQWEVVAEDYRPFNINITTSEAVFNSYPKNRRMRAVITPTETAAPGFGGVAYIGSFNWDNDVPCWVFALGNKYGGEATSHEIGHTFDLQHDGRRTTPDAEGYFGGLEGTPWAPIMGVGYYRPVSQWSKGEYNLANNQQDDLASITNPKFGVGYRVDDHSNSIVNATTLTTNTSGVVIQKNGVITNEADIDFFTFTTGGGNVVLNINTVSRHGNLDIQGKVYNLNGEQLWSYTNTVAGALNATVSMNIVAGKYYVSVDGTSAGSAASGGYSAYASIGSYTITGTIPPGGGGGGDLPFVSGDIFTLTAKHSDKNMTVNGASKANGANIDQWTKRKSKNQQFKFVHVADGFYQLQAMHSGKCADVASPSSDNGANVQQWDCSGAANQLWKFVKQTDGTYIIVSKGSGKALDVSPSAIAASNLLNGANVQQWDISGADNQKWWINPVPAPVLISVLLRKEVTESIESEVQVYPNPFEDVFNFSLTTKVLLSDVLLYDIQGRMQGIVVQNTSGNNYSVNTDGLPSGIYFLKITAKDYLKTIKLIKQ